MKLKEKKAEEYCDWNDPYENGWSYGHVHDAYQEGWDAAVEWCAENATTKEVLLESVDMEITVVDKESILVAKDVTV